MLVDCVITPDAFDIHEKTSALHHEAVLIELLRRIGERGFLADLEDGQLRTAFEERLNQKEVRQEFRRLALDGLKRLRGRNRFVQHPTGPLVADDEFQWLRRAITRHGAVEFDAIFSSEYHAQMFDGDRSSLCPAEASLAHPLWTNESHSLPGFKTENEFAVRLAPLLKYAGKLWLIDPYLSPHKDGCKATIKTCAELFGRQRKPTIDPRTIEIHAGDPERETWLDGGNAVSETSPQRIDSWKRFLQPLADKYWHKFRVCLWGRQPNGRRFHDRWIITDQAAITVGAGLDVEDQRSAPLTTWSLLPYNSCFELWKGFSSTSRIFRSLASTDISPQ